MTKRRAAPTIGWREWVTLPQLGVDAVKAKIDTGAATSALHVSELKERETKDGPVVEFVVHPVQRSSLETIHASAPLAGRRAVRNPGGRREMRPVIVTTARLGDVVFDIDLTLTSRDEMGFRMLLGRRAVRRRFLVDAGRSFLMGEPD